MKTRKPYNPKRTLKTPENGYPNSLRHLRITRGMTCRELGERIGVTAQAIHKYETTGKGLAIHPLLKLSDLFGCSIRELLTPPKNLPDFSTTY